MDQTIRPRVLIADDEKHMRLLMKAAMKKMNCEVVAEAGDGQEAVALYKNHQPDLLLLDINMPLKTGDEALKEIIDAFPQALVIMLTSVVEMETVEKCIDIGASNYIRKDTPIPEIVNIIQATLQPASAS
jgi:two-component system chemotaxis response regulator CheY